MLYEEQQTHPYEHKQRDHSSIILSSIEMRIYAVDREHKILGLMEYALHIMT